LSAIQESIPAFNPDGGFACMVDGELARLLIARRMARARGGRDRRLKLRFTASELFTESGGLQRQLTLADLSLDQRTVFVDKSVCPVGLHTHKSINPMAASLYTPRHAQ
jgi:hypothetical protein